MRRMFKRHFISTLILVLMISSLGFTIVPQVHAGNSVSFGQATNFNSGAGTCTVGVSGSQAIPAVTIGTDNFLVVQVAYSTLLGTTKPTWSVSDTLLSSWTIKINSYDSVPNSGLLMAVALTSSTGSDTVSVAYSGLISIDCPAGQWILTTWKGVNSNVVMASTNSITEFSSLSTTFTTTFSSVNPTWAFIGGASVRNSRTMSPNSGQTQNVASLASSGAGVSSDVESLSPINCSSNCSYSETVNSGTTGWVGALAVDPPLIPCSGTTGGCSITIAQQAVFAVVVLLLLGGVSLYMVRGTLDPEYYRKAMMYIIMTVVVILIIAASSIG